MAKILLDYFMPISVVEPIPAASTAFLKQVIAVCLPKSGQEENVGDIFECTNMTQVAARIDENGPSYAEVQQLFSAGMSRVYILLASDLDISGYLAEAGATAYTVLISSDFGDDALDGETPVPAVKAKVKIQDITYEAVEAGADGDDINISYTNTKDDGSAEVSVNGDDISVAIQSGVTTAATIATAINQHVDAKELVLATPDEGDETDPQSHSGVTEVHLDGGEDATTIPSEIDVGAFDGVVGFASDDPTVAQAFGANARRCPFLYGSDNGAKNMFYAFGKLLSNLSNWTNQQYIPMPFNDGVDELGEANSLFDNRVSFVINDTEFGNRLAMFCVGGKAIVAPYIEKNLRVDLQSRALTWVSANHPSYTLTNAALLEQRLQEDIINQRYIQTQWIEAGVISVRLLQDNFVANAEIDIAEPKALWRIFGQMQSTL